MYPSIQWPLHTYLASIHMTLWGDLLGDRRWVHTIAYLRDPGGHFPLFWPSYFFDFLVTDQTLETNHSLPVGPYQGLCDRQMYIPLYILDLRFKNESRKNSVVWPRLLVPLPWEVGPGQNGLSGPWPTSGARMASPDCGGGGETCLREFLRVWGDEQVNFSELIHLENAHKHSQLSTPL